MKFIAKILCLALTLSIVGCSNDSPKLVGDAVFNDDGFSEKPANFAVFNPKVDILFVIDSSGSMANVQHSLSSNAYLFANAISKMSILDYHIGVTTTDMDACRFGGSTGGDSCGQLVGYPAYVERSTVNMVDVLSRKFIVGTSGSASEQMFGPTIAALSPPMDTMANAGFYRQDAYLAVIFITDADDQSNYSPQDLIQFLNLKKGDSSKVLAYGVMRTLQNKDICSASETIEGKLEHFMSLVANTDKTQKNILSLCATDYGTKLAEFAKDIVTRSAGKVRLSRVPNILNPKIPMKVFYGTQEIPNDLAKGWVYEASTNSILLSEGIDWDITQGSTAELRIDFEAIELNPNEQAPAPLGPFPVF